jgi:hypothetical protein
VAAVVTWSVSVRGCGSDVECVSAWVWVEDFSPTPVLCFYVQGLDAWEATEGALQERCFGSLEVALEARKTQWKREIEALEA